MIMVSCTTLGSLIDIGTDNDTVIVYCVDGMYGCLMFNYQKNCGHRYFRIRENGVLFAQYSTDGEIWNGGCIPKHIRGIKL